MLHLRLLILYSSLQPQRHIASLKWTAIDRNSVAVAARQTSDWQSEMWTAWRAVVHTVLC